MRTQRAADMTVGWGVGLFGIVVLAASAMITVAGAHRLSPRAFPYAVAVLLIVCGVGLALKARWGNEGAEIDWPDREGVWTIVVTLASLGAYIALVNPLGLPIATFLYITFAIWHLKPAKWLTAIVIGVIMGGLSYVVFIRLLALSFPTGSLFE